MRPAVFRFYLAVVAVATVVLPIALRGLGHTTGGRSHVLTALMIAAASALNVEIGRVLEGGRADSQRPHKALSAWALASALLLPTWWLLPVVALTYAHAWWRGLRVAVWRWIGSGCYLVLCGTAAAVTSAVITGGDARLTYASGPRGLVAVLAAAAVFLIVETVLFHGSAYLNRPDHEIWLRRTLRGQSFYVTESAVLLVGGLSAAIWTAGPWLLVLLVPVYGLAQRAALHAPLRQRADYDEKTGVLRFQAWRRNAELSAERCARRRRPWSVLFVDIDHFKRFNDTFGHLAGDRALLVVAQSIVEELGEGAVTGRFGGEEFCVFHQGSAAEAVAIADRIRGAVARLDEPGVQGLTISVGLATARPEDDVDLDLILDHADRALLQAKQAGRNATAVRVVTGR